VRNSGCAPKARWLALNPGAEYGPAKRWPAERFAAVARTVQESGLGRWVLLGGRNDQPVTAAIRAQLDSALDLAGRTTLRELMAVLAATRLLLTNDTGPMHVAAALGLPIVVPFGSTSPELTGPGQPGDPLHRWVRAGAACSPCFLRECPIDFRCMLDIRIETVTAAVREILGTIPSRQS
jgi:heptosyltransferase-2